MLKKIFAFTLSLIMALTAFSVVPFSALAAVTAFDEFDTTGWTITNEGGVDVATRTSEAQGSNKITSLANNSGGYTEFEFKIKKVVASHDANVGMSFVCPSGYKFFFEYNPVFNYCRVRRLTSSGSNANGIFQSENDSYNFNDGNWHKMRVEHATNAIALFIDGNKIYSGTNTYSENLTKGQIYVSTYNTVSSVRNIDAVFEEMPEDNKSFLNWTTAELSWVKENVWSYKTVGGIQEARGEGTHYNRMALLGSTSSDEVSFDVRLDSVCDTKSSALNFIYETPKNHKFAFTYDAINKKFYVRYGNHYAKVTNYNGGVSDSSRTVYTGKWYNLGSAVSYTLTPETWYKIKLVLKENDLELIVNNSNVLTIDDTLGDSLYSGNMELSGVNAQVSFRSIEMDNFTAEQSVNEKLDFNFKKLYTSNAGFTASGGNVSVTAGAPCGELTFDVTSNNSYLQSPNIRCNEGHQYCWVLPKRNSFFLRLKNSTAATKMKLSFTLSTSLNYCDEQSILFDVEPNSDYKSYLVNLSDVGYFGGEVRSFRLQPVSVSSGSIKIKSIRMECEKETFDYAGTLTCASANKNTIQIQGTVKPEFADKKVKLYETTVENYDNSLNENEKIAEVTADGTNFSFTIPLKGSKPASRLAAVFIVGVEGIRICDVFHIDNVEDFMDNPYDFSLPNVTVDVTKAPYNAKGDGFTNDTHAIQDAIDDLSALGGGTVLLPGDDTFMGKRYYVSTIWLKDNIELKIDENATVWQATYDEYYEYPSMEYGGNHPASQYGGVPWVHKGISTNYPLVYAGEVNNVKISGKGTIRDEDRGNQCEYAKRGSDSVIWLGGDSRIHLTPIGMFKCTNVSITGVTLTRTNNYYLFANACDNIYMGNIAFTDPSYPSADGTGFSKTKNGIIEFLFACGNDDILKASTNVSDPRACLWWHPIPEGKKTENCTVRYSNVSGGWGFCLINWASNAENLELYEIHNITVHDCIFDGYRGSLGHWDNDNPFYTGAGPVSDLVMYNNYYPSNQNVNPVVTVTNVLTDNKLKSAPNFLYGDFERHDAAHPEWVTGLANWTRESDKGGEFSFETDGDNHYAKITGSGRMFEGLYVSGKSWKFNIDVNLIKGDARLFAKNSRTGEIIAEKPIEANGGFEHQSLIVNLTKASDVQFGVELLDTEKGILLLDNAILTEPGEDEEEEVKDPDVFDGWSGSDKYSTKSENGYVVLTAPNATSGSANAYAKEMNFNSNYIEVQIKYDKIFSSSDGNIGFIVYLKSGKRLFFEYNTAKKYVQLRRMGAVTSEHIVLIKEDLDLTLGLWHTMRAEFRDGKVWFYINGNLIGSCTNADTTEDLEYFTKLSITAYNCTPNFRAVKYDETSVLGGEFKDWEVTDSVWNYQYESGEQVLKIAQRDGQKVNYTSDKGGNAIEFDGRVDVNANSTDSNLGFIFTTASSNKFFFEYNEAGHYARIRRLGATYEIAKTSVGSVNLNLKTWHRYKFVIKGNFFGLYIDGALVCSNTFAHGETISTSGGYINHYNTYVSIKNINYGYTVDFNDNDGNELLSTVVKTGEFIPESVIKSAENLVPDIEDYDKVIDEYGDLVWDKNTVTKVNSPLVFTPTYKEHINTYTVTFLDILGNVLEREKIEEFSFIPYSMIKSAAKQLPDIYGYEKTSDDKGDIMWNDDVARMVTADITFKPLYKKKSEKYTVNVTLSSGKTDTYSLKFDDKLSITDSGASAFKVGGEIIGIPKNGVTDVFVFGDMDITAEKGTSPVDAVEFVGSSTNIKNGYNAFTVFGHIVNVSGKKIKKVGVSFISSTYYNLMSPEHKNSIWSEIPYDEYGKRAATVAVGTKYSDFMVSLEDITITKEVTRYAQAYVIFEDNTTLISKPIYKVFNENIGG